MKRALLFLALCVAPFAAGCLKVDEPEQPVPAEIPAEIVFLSSNLPPAVEISDTTLKISGKSVVADFNLDGLDDIAIVEEADVTAPENSEQARKGGKAAGVASIKAPEVTVYLQFNGGPGASPDAAKMYQKAGVIPSVSGKLVAGIASRKSRQYTDLVILFKEDGGGTEMVHYQNTGDRFIKIGDASAE